MNDVPSAFDRLNPSRLDSVTTVEKTNDYKLDLRVFGFPKRISSSEGKAPP